MAPRGRSARRRRDSSRKPRGELFPKLVGFLAHEAESELAETANASSRRRLRAETMLARLPSSPRVVEWIAAGEFRR